MRRMVTCMLLLVLVAGMASAQTIWTPRVEENGRLLVPVRGIFEAFGATVDWSGYDQSATVNYQGRAITMWVNNPQAYIDGAAYYLDVPPRNVGGRVHIPLRFVGEAMGKTVNYQGDRVVISSGGNAELTIMLQGSTLPPPPQMGGEILPQSNDRHLNNADLAGMSNWRLTLARNEIYARHGRPFDNANVRAYFQSTGWYRPNANFRESWLSQTESRNAVFIREYQEGVFGRPATSP